MGGRELVLDAGAKACRRGDAVESRVRDRCRCATSEIDRQQCGRSSSVLDVSILVGDGRGVDWCVGVQPGPNTSMMCMRPPQQGHGVGSTRGSSAPGASVGSGLGGGGATAISCRTCRRPTGKSEFRSNDRQPVDLRPLCSNSAPDLSACLNSAAAAGISRQIRDLHIAAAAGVSTAGA